MTPFELLSEEAFRKSLDINLISNFLGMKAVLPDMKKAGWGHIVSTASVAALSAGGDSCAYTASKHAVSGLSKCAAHALAPYNILVNSVLPGAVDTPMMDGVKALGPEINAQLCAKIPLRRMARPEELASLVLFLSSEENTYMTGSQVIIDGGKEA